jgi:hypothetical protein
MKAVLKQVVVIEGVGSIRAGESIYVLDGIAFHPGLNIHFDVEAEEYMAVN